MIRTIILYSLLIFLPFSFSFAQYTPGQTYFGTSDYIEYHAGDLPIIVSAPHGGYLIPPTIPDRNCTGCVTGRDSRTQELIRDIDSAVQVLFGGHPHIIINRLARIKLDANREIVEAASGDMEAETAWAEYHAFLQAAKDSSKVNFGSALYIDLHGHGHTIQRIELGYLLSRSRLQDTDATLDAANRQNSSSLKHLTNVLNPGTSFAEILRGNECMGEFLVEQGYPSTPSASDPAPAPADPYFSGGYNTVRHGSRDSSVINSIQFEMNWTGARSTNANRKGFARGLACAMRDYLDRWFFDLDSWVPGHVVTSTADHGPGTLRDVLLGAGDGDIITFDAALSGDTIRLAKELRICRGVTIQGPGASSLAISGGDSTRLIRIMRSDSVNILDVSLVRGHAPTGTDGGAIVVEGVLRLVNCIVSNNYADDDGGGLNISENAAAYLDSCTVQHNSCGDDGGGFRNFRGLLVIENSTVDNNHSSSWGGGISSSGTIRIAGSTFLKNNADGVGGGVRAFGGSLEIVNSTFTMNTAGSRVGGISASTNLALRFCTIVNNSAASLAGGVQIEDTTAIIENTLIAKNSAPRSPDVSSDNGTFVSQGYNLIGDTTGSAWTPAIADQLGNGVSPIDPLVQPLTSNGGSTATVELSAGSPCIDQGNGVGAPATDQRGWPRVYNSLADIGAFESQPPLHLYVDVFGAENQASFELFPNPGKNHITIAFPQKGDYQITIGNMWGQSLLQVSLKDTDQKRIEVAEWPEGSYWIRVNGKVTADRVFMVKH